MAVFNDEGSLVERWSDKKLFAETRRAIDRAASAESDALALDHVGGARAILSILAARLSIRARRERI